LSPRKIKRRKSVKDSPGRVRRARKQLAPTFERAERLIERGRPDGAIALLEPLLTEHERVTELHNFLGYAYAESGRIWEAIRQYERAKALSNDPGYWQPLAVLYTTVGLPAHTLRPLRRIPEEDFDKESQPRILEWVQLTKQHLAELADAAGLPLKKAEKGFYEWEEGQIELGLNDFEASIAANRRAVEILGDWPPPNNNLAQALFYNGQPEAAIEVERRVIASAPDNIHALANAIRFLTLSGREEEARTLWAQLKALTPDQPDLRVKMAEAAAALDEDDSVYELLATLEEEGAMDDLAPGLGAKVQFLLAVAEANLGHPNRARRRFNKIRRLELGADIYLRALKAKKPGLGWTKRYSYDRIPDLMPRAEFEAFTDLLVQHDEMPEDDFRQQVAGFAQRFPQVVRFAEKLIWEEMQPDVGMALLDTIRTPKAHAALRRFALSRAGDDDSRMEALSYLSDAGVLGSDEVIRIWMNGEWREVQWRKYEIVPERECPYADEVVTLLEQALDAFREDKYAEAEPLFRRAIELEPQAKEAYNNLATLYARQDKHDQAREMFRAALDIDPLYAFPRCNLASYLMEEDDIDGAIEMLKPLADATNFSAQEVSFYYYTQARISIAQEEYDAAQNALETALEIWPEYELAQDLLDRLGMIRLLEKSFSSWQERMYRRDAARRAKLQAKLTTPNPTLSKALPLYTKDALTGMGRSVIPWGGWSAYRKAKLVEEIIKALTDPHSLSLVVNGLSDEARTALQCVLDQSGTMPWSDFDTACDNDLDESPYWNWHEPESVMGNLRVRGLLAEATVDGEIIVTIPTDLRQPLRDALDRTADGRQ
jgi:tetratricopeptide (TPR) repeat protein